MCWIPSSSEWLSRLHPTFCIMIRQLKELKESFRVVEVNEAGRMIISGSLFIFFLSM